MATTQEHDQIIAGNVRAEIARANIGSAAIIDLFGFSKDSLSRRMRGQTPWSASEIKKLEHFMLIPENTLTKIPTETPEN